MVNLKKILSAIGSESFRSGIATKIKATRHRSGTSTTACKSTDDFPDLLADLIDWSIDWLIDWSIHYWIRGFTFFTQIMGGGGGREGVILYSDQATDVPALQDFISPDDTCVMILRQLF